MDQTELLVETISLPRFWVVPNLAHWQIVNPADKSVVIQVITHDEKNGTHKAFYNCTVAGKFELWIYSEGEAIKVLKTISCLT